MMTFNLPDWVYNPGQSKVDEINLKSETHGPAGCEIWRQGLGLQDLPDIARLYG
jgi:hypothetical protein